MEASLPHEIVYDTAGPVPVADIIESLRGALRLTEEIGPLLEGLIPGLQVQDLTITLREISQESPLREAFAFGLVGVYQESIGKDMPNIIHHLFGTHLPAQYDNIVSLLFIVLVFYAGQFIHNAAGKLVERRKLRREFNGLISAIAKMLNKSEDSVKRVIKDKFGGARIGPLVDCAARVLLPSKNQANAPLTINRHALSHELVAEFPSAAQRLEDAPEPITTPLEDVEITLHAQDRDYSKRGWAVVVPALSSKRIPMYLYPPIKPKDIYTKAAIRGDLMVEHRQTEAGEREPIRVHLIRVRDRPTNPPTALPPPPARRGTPGGT